MNIEAANPKEAYEKFIEKVGEHPRKVIVEFGWLLKNEIFNDHIEAANQKAEEPKRKAEEAKRKAEKQAESQRSEEDSLY